MQKIFEVTPRQGAWDVRHNQVGFRHFQSKREAIRVAILLGRMQLRLGDEAKIVVCDDHGEARAQRHISASHA